MTNRQRTTPPGAVADPATVKARALYGPAGEPPKGTPAVLVKVSRRSPRTTRKGK